MRLLTFLVVITFMMISCINENLSKEEIIASNPFLKGKWKGEGRFLNADLARKIGPVLIEFEIKEDGDISGKMGEADFINTDIKAAKFGFEILAELDDRITKDSNPDKDHLIILLVVPGENRDNVNSSDANFHLKSNYAFDFSMNVGGVLLEKVTNE